MMSGVNKEMFYTAKLYLDKLSNGIDPVENVEVILFDLQSAKKSC